MRKLLVATVAAASLLATAGCGLLGEGSREITAVLPDTSGLFLGNDVGVLGVPVGTITEIEPKGDSVEVTLKITDDDLRIPADVGAAVVARSVATDRYVELTPVYTSGAQMPDGGRIPVERTVTPVDFDQVLASLTTFSDGLTSTEASRNGIKDLVRVAAKSLEGNGTRLNTSVGALSKAVSGVQGQTDNVVGTLESLDALTGTLARNERVVRTFIDDVAAAADLAAAERLNLGSALRTLQRAVTDVSRFAEENRAAVKTSVADLTAVTEQLLRSGKDLNGTLDNLPLATDNLARVVSPTGRARVKIDPTVLLPVADLLEPICAALPVCDDVIGIPPNIPVLRDVLNTLLGGDR